MVNSDALFTVLALLGCLLTGISLAYLLYRKTPQLDKKAALALASLRTILITLIAFLLFFPLIRNVSYELEKPVIVIGQDNSTSIRDIQSNGFNLQRYQQDMELLKQRLSDKYEVRVHHFSDSVGSGYDFNHGGKSTNAAAFVAQLNDELINRNVGAVILLSDGIFNTGGNPAYDLAKLKAPVYTVALGDVVPKRDILIANVNHNDVVYLDNEFTVEVQVQAPQSAGTNTKLKVFQDKTLLSEVPLSITANPYVKTLPLTIKAGKVGVQKLTISVDEIANEVSVVNNKLELFIEVVDARQKVLIAAGAPHPDIAIFKQAIDANKQYEVKTAIGEGLNTVNPADYDVIILYQLPSLYNDGSTFLNKVKSGNSSLWYVVGASSSLSHLNQYQNGISYGGGSGTLQEAYPLLNPNFTSFNIDATSVKKLERFDPLQAPFGSVSLKAEATIALNQRIGKINTQYPQLIFTTANNRKSAYLIGEGIWKWKMAEAINEDDESLVGDILSKSIQYLSAKDDKRKFRTSTSKNTFEENEDVVINAVLYNDSYVAVNTPDISAQVKSEDGKVFNFLFSRTASAYQLNAGNLSKGNYSYKAQVTLGDKKYEASGAFYVKEILAEHQQTIANHEILKAMASQTNGKMYLPADLLKIVEEIKANDQITTVSYEDRKYEELINFKWLFVLIMLLLTTEWFFRKRSGEI